MNPSGEVLLRTSKAGQMLMDFLFDRKYLEWKDALLAVAHKYVITYFTISDGTNIL